MDGWARRRTSHCRTWAEAAIVALCAGGFLALVVVWVLFWTWVFMVCWNLVVPSVFGGPELSFWQAFALSVVVNVLGSGLRASVQVKR